MRRTFMRKTHIKVCGMTDYLNIRALNQLPVDMIGFIFVAESPRYISPEMYDVISSLQTTMQKCGVFVNESAQTISEIALRCRLDCIQLHGDEPPELCHQIKKLGYQIVKVFSISTAEDFNKCSFYMDVCDLFLFDTKCIQHGGSGLKFNWELLNSYTLNKPFILSGGIGPDDAESLHGLFKKPGFYGIDLNSQFEIRPGIKNIETLKSFIETLKNL